MSISKAFRVLSLVLAAVLLPATAFAGTTDAAAGRAAKVKTLKISKVKPSAAKAGKAGKKVLKVSKSKTHARPKIHTQKH